MKKIVALLLAAVCLVSMSGIFAQPLRAQAAAVPNEINGRKLIAENDKYALYMEEEYLSIVVLDKATGSYMESAISYDDGKNNDMWMGSMKSALVLTYIYGIVDTNQVDLVNDDATKKITYTDNGFSAEVYWTKYQFGMTLNVSLEQNGIVASIPEDSIREDSESYYIGTISIYPFLGYSYLDDKEGYMLLPDGNGALIYLDDKEGWFNSGFTKMVYGEDIGLTLYSTTALLWDRYNIINSSNNIIAPIFGMAHTDDKIAFLGVIEDGSQRAAIVASPNGVNVDYNRIYARFTERTVYTQYNSNNSSSSFKTAETQRSHSDLTVRYLFLSGDEANYSGMANAYREYLLNRGDLVADDTSYNTRIDFLGTERESWLIGTTAVTMTTVDDIREIYSDLDSAGVTDIFTVYKGWQKGGLYNLPITSYKADSKIGGTKELTALIKEAEQSGIHFYLYNDALRLNPDEASSTFNVVKQVNRRQYQEETHKDVYDYFLYLIPSRTDTLLTKFLKSYTKQGVDNVAIAGISNKLYSNYYKNVLYSRFDNAQTYDNTLSSISAQANVVLEQPYAYLWKYTDAFLDMPLYTSNYMYEDESVPFLSMVLKGVIPVYSEYVNFEANKQEYFLKLIETGTYPSFYITKEDSSKLIYTNSSDIYSSQYETYKSTIVEYAEELSSVNDKVSGAYIVGHEILDNGIRVVTYSNGVKIYLNYGETQAQADGYTIDAMSYKVVN